MGGSDITLRAAQDKDGPALAELAIMAAHGVMNLLYEGLIPGHSVAEAIIERRLRNPASFCALQHWRVAEDAQGRVLGGLNSLPNVELAKSVSDPAIGPDRLEPLTKLFDLDQFLVDTYYVNMIAVFPQHRRSGAGRADAGGGKAGATERTARHRSHHVRGGCRLDRLLQQAWFHHSGKAVDPAASDVRVSSNWVLMIRDLPSGEHAQEWPT